ncbi:hypothetical protein Ciccas_005565 [Cichlidogyrus casuarinus]|uniref:Uncharacterized protein n=1 Tax=Cichlidogyrus casuarinus TaxID=1844966 RepID=A0ABD2Q8I0_9PLAT
MEMTHVRFGAGRLPQSAGREDVVGHFGLFCEEGGAVISAAGDLGFGCCAGTRAAGTGAIEVAL